MATSTTLHPDRPTGILAGQAAVTIEVPVYTLAWSDDTGVGCDVFTSEAARDDAFFLSLVGYCPAPIRAKAMAGEIELDDLFEYLDDNDLLGGAVYARATDAITVTATVTTSLLATI